MFRCVHLLISPRGPSVLISPPPDCKALSTNDSHTVDLIDLTYSSGDEADLGHVVDQGGAHATGCIQHTPATKPGKAAPATGAKPRPSVHQKCLVVADIGKERGHPAPSEKIAEASGAGKGAMRRMTDDRGPATETVTKRKADDSVDKTDATGAEPSCRPNKRRNAEEASRRSGPYASSQRAASGGGYQPKATEAKEHLRRMVESLEEPQIEENQVGTGKEITIGSKVNVYYVLKVWNGAAFEVFCSLTSHVPAVSSPRPSSSSHRLERTRCGSLLVTPATCLVSSLFLPTALPY